jgi:hypothetical protein
LPRSSPSRCLLAWLVICSLMASAVFVETSTARIPDPQASLCSHPCPDPAPSGAPCHDDCPCLCCPGHRYGGAIHGRLVARVPDEQHELLVIVQLPVLQEHVPRVFRPPRSSST